MKNFFDKDRPSSADIMQSLRALKSGDIPLQTGKTMAYVYEPSPEAYQLQREAYTEYLTENGIDPTAFQSVLKLEHDVIGLALDLLGGDEASAGNFTFGGTESIMLAIKSARDYAREHRAEITRPNIVLPVTAHAAFFKACHYLCVDPVVVPVDKDTFVPEMSSIEDAIDSNTIMLIASAPSYTHGVMDPVSDIAALAQRKGLLCHVDACVGGFYLPFARMAGYDIPAFDLSVEGVTSISADFHKYGYTAKGASCILYKEKSLRKYQIYTCADWSGYAVVNPTVLSSKTSGSLAACWANFSSLGAKGYEEIVSQTQEARIKVENYLKQSEHYRVLGRPVMNMIAFTSDHIDLFNCVKMMKEKGWYIQLQFEHGISPTNIHLSVNRANVPFIDDFINDLTEVTALLVGQEKSALPFPKEMLAQLTPEMLAQLKSGLGVGDGEVPEDMTLVSRLLNEAPPQIRAMMLQEFMNDLLR